jgi:SAM-dependent methyltransferase
VCGAKSWRLETSGIRDWEYGIHGVYDYHRCGGCSVVQLHPFPTLDDLVKAYDIDYHGYVDPGGKGLFYRVLFAMNDRVFARRLRKLVPPGSAVLDIGCGSGAFLEQIRRIAGASVEGIDFSSRAAEAATRRGIPVFKGVFADFDRPLASYDAIFMNNYLEHTVDPLGELRKCKRLLRPGARLIGEVPNFDSIDRHMFGRFWGGNHVPRHTFQFDPPALRSLLARAGFDDATTTCEVNPAHVAISVQNLLQRRRTDLRNNPALAHGRARYYSALLLLFAPLNAVAAVAGKSGVMKFHARA